jgi:hypothetical protein
MESKSIKPRMLQHLKSSSYFLSSCFLLIIFLGLESHKKIEISKRFSGELSLVLWGVEENLL